MEKVKLQFPTPQDLTAFRKQVKNTCVTVLVDLTLECELTKEEIARAMNSFGASVIEKKFTS